MMLRRGRILVLVFLLLRGVDRFKRYYEVVKEIDGARYVLDAGSGGRSLVSYFRCVEVVSLVVRLSQGIDVVASVAMLLFRDSVFDVVLLVDVLSIYRGGIALWL